MASNFRGGRYLEDSQVDKLGQLVFDKNGREFGFAKVGGAFEAGQSLRVALHDDLVATASDQNNVTGNSPVGGNLLVSAGAFKGKKGFVEGAFGMITAGAGKGQSFVVEAIENDNTIRVRVVAIASAFNDQANPNAGNWNTALDNTSRFTLTHPDVVFATDDAASWNVGVAQTKAETADVGKYVHPLRKGVGAGKSDASGTGNITAGAFVSVTAGGLFELAPNTVAGVKNTVGRAITGEDGSTDGLILISFDYKTPDFGTLPPNIINAFRKVDVRG